MSDDKTSAPTLNVTATQPVIDKLAALKAKADLIGVSYPNNIGEDALREKINAKLNPEPEEEKKEVKEEAPENDQWTLPLNEVTDQVILRKRMHDEAMALVRVRIANLNPSKKDIPGEWISVHNKFIGTVRKFIPFGEATDNGYHIPKIIYDTLVERRFVNLKTKKGDNGSMLPSHVMVKEFAIEVLEPLTEDELAQLARQQAAAKGM